MIYLSLIAAVMAGDMLGCLLQPKGKRADAAYRRLVPYLFMLVVVICAFEAEGVI